MPNPMNIMDVANYVQQQGDIGRQQGLAQRFNALAGQAYTAPAGSERDALVGQAVGTDPRMGVQLGNVLANRDATAAQAASTAQNDQMKKVGGAARYMAQAIQTKNPAAIEGAYQAVRPFLSQLGAAQGKVPPEHYDPSMDAAIQQVIAQTGGMPDQKGVVVSAGGQVINPMTGEVIARNPYGMKYQNVPMGQSTAAGSFDPNTGQVRPAVGGAPQPRAPQPQQAPQQPSDPMQPIIAKGNQMVAQGIPQAQVEAWMQQQAQGAGLNPQPAGAMDQGQPDPQGMQAQDMPGAAGQPASSLSNAQPPAQFGVGTPKESGEIATLKTLQNNPKLMATWQLMHPSTGGMGSAPSGYRYNADRTALEPIPGGPADAAGSGQGLSTDAIDNAAWAYIGSGKLPAVGRGKEGVAQRTAVMNKSAEIAKAAGIPASELQTVPGRNKALQSSLTNLQKISDVMEKSENAFQNNTKVAMDLSANLSRTGSPALNKWILGAKAEMGDPDVQALDAAITTMSVDYARIMSGATGAGGTPISTAEEAKSLIRKELSHQSLAAVVDVLNKDIAGQQSAVHGQRGKILGAMQQMHDESSPTTPGLNPPRPQPASGDFSHLWGSQ